MTKHGFTTGVGPRLSGQNAAKDQKVERREETGGERINNL